MNPEHDDRQVPQISVAPAICSPRASSTGLLDSCVIYLVKSRRNYLRKSSPKELAIVNGVAEDARLERGQKIKRIVGGELPSR